MTYLHKADDIEKQLYVDKIKELEAKLGLLEQDRKMCSTGSRIRAPASSM